MKNLARRIALAALAATLAACGVGSEAVGPVGTPAAPRAARVRVQATYEGAWHLAVDGARLTLTLRAADGTLSVEGSDDERPVEGLRWDEATGRLQFHVLAATGYQWFDGVVAGSVVRGRVARGDADQAPRTDAYAAQFTGWNATRVDATPYPRVFDLRVSDGRRARVRIDRADVANAAPIATFKVYGSDARGAGGEEPERPAREVFWDGAAIGFTVDYPGGPLVFRGAVDGRRARGDASLEGSLIPLTWTATRAEVLSHGFTARSRDEVRAWGDRTRRSLTRLMMNGAPRPSATRVTVVSEGLTPIRPLVAEAPGALPQAYTLSQVRFEHTLADPRGGPDARRVATAWIARPNAAPPARGYPLCVALNGHGGSAFAVMDPNAPLFGYGDAYARLGFVVVAIDISHRPVADRAGLYTDVPDGDGPTVGNRAHPAIRHGALSPDWEEDGERAWDVSRAIDHALSLPTIDRSRIAVTGLSMGAEVATMVGALDERVSTVIAAGYSPDLNVMNLHGNHACWRWQQGDVTEYVDASDLLALVAPRTLVVETGTRDLTFSGFIPPFAADKQVMRRSRVAWGSEASRVVHFLHGGAHVYRVGDPFFDDTTTRGITVATVIEPSVADPLAWQFDGATTLHAMSVFDLAASGFSR